LIRNNKSPINF